MRNHRLVASHGAHLCYLVGSIIARLYDWTLKHPYKVLDLNEVRVSGVLVAHQEQIKLSFCQSLFAKIKSVQAAVLEVFMCAVPVALGEYAEHELNLAVESC